jgi:Cu-Zn family superoxide dismutase
MKKSILTIAILALCFNTSCKEDKKETETNATEVGVEKATKGNEKPSSNADNKKLKVTLEAKSGSNVTGSAVFTQENGVVTMIAVLGGLTEGTHAMHLHEKADCSSSDGKSSGGHWNPTAQPHGQWGSPDGFHKGDIGNIVADAKGNVTKTFSTDEWCIGCGDAEKDIIGKAIIIHEGTDDYKTQPTGNAGGRVSCGGIIQ